MRHEERINYTNTLVQDLKNIYEDTLILIGKYGEETEEVKRLREIFLNEI